MYNFEEGVRSGINGTSGAWLEERGLTWNKKNETGLTKKKKNVYV